jgi:hypothetical protein
MSFFGKLFKGDSSKDEEPKNYKSGLSNDLLNIQNKLVESYRVGKNISPSHKMILNMKNDDDLYWLDLNERNVLKNERKNILQNEKNIKEDLKIQKSLEIEQKVQLKKDESKLKKEKLVLKYGKEIGTKLYNGEFFVGMTIEMVKEIIPKNAEKVENVVSSKKQTKFFYQKSKNRLGNVSYAFEVTLEDGILVGWKDRRNRGTKDL